MKVFAVLLAGTICLFTYLAYAVTNDNVYAIEGYEHGVAICVDEGTMVVINEGHGEDIEAILLLTDGTRYCDKYNK